MSQLYSESTYGAPWGMPLKVLTAFSVLVLAGVTAIGSFTGPQELLVWKASMVWTPTLVLVIGFFFQIRAYDLTSEFLFVRRPGWSSTINLSGLVSAEADPAAMAKSIRLIGNGGMFCFAGLFRNKKLGTYRMFATEPKLAVVLRFPSRTLVITPDRPDEFVADIRERLGMDDDE